MTDYLANLAARTVECPDASTHRCPSSHDEHGAEAKCVTCEGSGRVLDPRFEGLRRKHTRQTHGIKMSILHGDCWKTCETVGCPGYTVNRDLEVLLECTGKGVYLYPSLSGEGRRCDLLGTDIDITTEATYLEAAAKAVYEWLEAEK
ncbi:hypothetical protein LCGC14_0264350 [marine sediment metagenome]|uniref:Uncharacterized protein n=1 Tax=marine sediment metagenome TaxID=412755 RepID=A0A0F9X5P6_9ZZZZ